MPRRRTFVDCPETRIPCWVHGCPQANQTRVTEAVPVRLKARMIVSLVLCGSHADELRELTGQSEREEWPAA